MTRYERRGSERATSRDATTETDRTGRDERRPPAPVVGGEGTAGADA